jgi:membrane protease subunit (stomatin/prohibitin family)
MTDIITPRVEAYATTLAALHTPYRAARQLFMASLLEHASSRLGGLSQAVRSLQVSRKAAGYMLHAGKLAKAQLTEAQQEAAIKLAWLIYAECADVNTYSAAGKYFSRLLATAALRTAPTRAKFIGGTPEPNKCAAAKLIHVHRNQIPKMLRKEKETA